MVLDLFEPFDKENNNQDDAGGMHGDDDDQVLLKGNFQDILDKGWNYDDFYDYVATKIVWTESTASCAVVRSDPPTEDDGLGYAIDFIVEVDHQKTKKKKEKKLQVAAKDAASAAATLQGLILLCGTSSSSSNNANDDDDDDSETKITVTIKCFARNPRQVLPTLQGGGETLIRPGHRLASLKFSFVALDETTCQTVVSCPRIDHVEFRQCTLNGSIAVLKNNDNNYHNDGDGVQRMTISCTMPEFAKIAAGFLEDSGSHSSDIRDLELQLHFWLQGDGFHSFARALEQSNYNNNNLGGLERLSIEYLDINDEGWVTLLKALHGHPKLHTLKLGFTEKFVDTFRKLTPDRRMARSQAVLELVQANKTILQLEWPVFQQDEGIIAQVEKCLESNRSKNQI